MSAAAAATLQRVERVALLNEAHDVRNFLLAERSVMRYAPYAISRRRAAFRSRRQLLDYEAALQVCAHVC